MRKKLPANYPSFPLYNEEEYWLLTPNQQRFLFGYFLKPMTGKNNAQIYQEAYTRQGNTPRQTSAEAAASQMIHKNEKIKRLLAKLAKVHFERMHVSSQRIINEEKTIAFSDVAELFDKDGLLIKNPIQLPEHVRRAISGITEVTDKQGNVRFTIKLWSKSDSLRRLQKMKGMEKPTKHEITGPNGTPVQMQMTNDYDFTTLSDDEMITFKELLAKAKV